MNDDLPAPLTTVECDLTGYDYMPLHGHKLFTSKVWVKNSHEGRVAALRLWWQSYLEVPAASLPDDDDILSDFAGYGVAIDAWLAIKEKAMRGWIKCSDGRFYHPFLAEVALKAWGERVKSRDRRAKSKERYEKKKKPSRAKTQNPHTASRKINALKVDKGSEAKRSEGSTSLSPAIAGSEREDDFEGFWKAYPHPPNDSKPKAKAEWDRLPDPPQSETLGAACRGYADLIAAENKKRSKTDPYRVCNASTWLKERRFEGFADKASIEQTHVQEAEERRLAQIPGTGPWNAAATGFIAKHGQRAWDAAFVGCRLRDDDVDLVIEFQAKWQMDRARESGALVKLAQVAKADVRPVVANGRA